MHAWEAYEKGQDIHLQAAPSQAEPLHREFKIKKEKLKAQTKEDIYEKYGNAASEERPPMELLLGQTDRQVEYDRAGRIIKGQEKAVAKSKYEEDVYINNHTTVWGSWWKDGQWGYKCCRSFVRNSYCTGQAGIDAAEAVAESMRVNLEKKGELQGMLVIYVLTCSQNSLAKFSCRHSRSCVYLEIECERDYWNPVLGMVNPSSSVYVLAKSNFNIAHVSCESLTRCISLISEKPAQKEEKNSATWGSEVADDIQLDQKKLKAALKKVCY
jgi:hypothetical protein